MLVKPVQLLMTESDPRDMHRRLRLEGSTSPTHNSRHQYRTVDNTWTYESFLVSSTATTVTHMVEFMYCGDRVDEQGRLRLVGKYQSPPGSGPQPHKSGAARRTHEATVSFTKIPR